MTSPEFLAAGSADLYAMSSDLDPRYPNVQKPDASAVLFDEKKCPECSCVLSRKYVSGTAIANRLERGREWPDGIYFQTPFSSIFSDRVVTAVRDFVQDRLQVIPIQIREEGIESAKLKQLPRPQYFALQLEGKVPWDETRLGAQVERHCGTCGRAILAKFDVYRPPVVAVEKADPDPVLSSVGARHLTFVRAPVLDRAAKEKWRGVAFRPLTGDHRQWMEFFPKSAKWREQPVELMRRHLTKES